VGPHGAAAGDESDVERERAGDVRVEGAVTRELFEPSPPQWALFQQLQRFNVIVCHRGFGKTFLAVNVLIRQALKRPGTFYAFIAKTYGQAKDIAWQRVLKLSCEPLVAEHVVEFNESELRANFANGSQIKLYGAENAETLRGLHLDGVVFDEYGLIPPATWEQIVSPTLTRRKGGAIFIGTPMGRNHFFSLYKHALSWPDWFATTIRAEESGVLPDEELARQRQIQTPEQYAQEYECSFETAISGAYYARELRTARAAGRVRQVAYDPALPVTTWWDLGRTDATAIIFAQFIGREIHLIDYAEDKGLDLASWAKILQGKPYLYQRHHLPHDADAKHLAAAGRSIADQLRGLNVRPITVHPSQDVLHGINQARLLFSRCYFDADKCERLLDCLAFYHAKVDEKHQVERPEPEHDWSSHAADAFRYLALGAQAAERMTDDRPRVHTAKMAAPPLPAIGQGRRANTGVLIPHRMW
jgi:phage terminase large subunit